MLFFHLQCSPRYRSDEIQYHLLKTMLSRSSKRHTSKYNLSISITLFSYSVNRLFYRKTLGISLGAATCRRPPLFPSRHTTVSLPGMGHPRCLGPLQSQLPPCFHTPAPSHRCQRGATELLLPLLPCPHHAAAHNSPSQTSA